MYRAVNQIEKQLLHSAINNTLEGLQSAENSPCVCVPAWANSGIPARPVIPWAFNRRRLGGQFFRAISTGRRNTL